MTAFELAQVWERWLSHEVNCAWCVGRHCGEGRRCLAQATAANARVLAEERQYAEDAVRLSGEMSAGAKAHDRP